MKLTIDRSSWARGKFRVPDKSNALLNEDGTMCCLGFYSIACGIPKEHLLHVAVPELIPLKVPGFRSPETMDWLQQRDNLDPDGLKWCDRFALVNDDKTIDEPTREQWLTEKFAEHAVEVEFV